MARATSSLPTPLSPRISTVALVSATRPICVSMLLIGGAVADQLALDLAAGRAASGSRPTSDCLLLQVVDDAAELLGDGDGELQVLGVERLVRVGAVQVDQAEHLARRR